MTDSDKVYMLKDALMMLLDLYKCSVANECQCDCEDGDEEIEQCSYCYVMEILNNLEGGD
jgi:hypothetical protein